MSPAPLPGRASGGVGKKNVEISRTQWQRANCTLNWPIDWQSDPGRCWMQAPTIANRAKTKPKMHIGRHRESRGQDINIWPWGGRGMALYIWVITVEHKKSHKYKLHANTIYRQLVIFALLEHYWLHFLDWFRNEGHFQDILLKGGNTFSYQGPKPSPAAGNLRWLNM